MKHKVNKDNNIYYNMKRICILFFVTISLLSCDNKIGENVYVEVWNEGYKLHIDKQCDNIYKNHMVEFVKTKDLADKYARTPLLSLCPKCVSDENADKLKSFIENHPDTTATYY